MTAPRETIASTLALVGWDQVRRHGATTVWQSRNGACCRLTANKAHVYAHPNVHPGWAVAEMGLVPATAVIAYLAAFDRALHDMGGPTPGGREWRELHGFDDMDRDHTPEDAA